MKIKINVEEEEDRVFDRSKYSGSNKLRKTKSLTRIRNSDIFFNENYESICLEGRKDN